MRPRRILTPAVLALACALATARPQAEELGRWREALLLDEAPRVVAEGWESVQPEGRLGNDPEAVALVVRALAQSGDEKRAQVLLENASEPARAGGLLAIEGARIDLVNDRLDDALERLCTDATPRQLRFPEQNDAYLLVGRALARNGDLRGAAPWLRTFLDRTPYSSEAPSAWYMLGQEALERRDAATARACFERQSKTARWHGYFRARTIQARENPDAPLPRLGLAQLWLQAGEAARAKSILTELLERFPTECAAHLALAEALRKLGELDAARARYGRAIECDPDLWEARFNRGLLARMLSDSEAAKADFEALLAGPAGTDPRWALAHLELARLLLAGGDTEAAQKRYAAYQQLGGREPLRP